MKKLAAILRTGIMACDTLLMLLAPLSVIAIVVCVIVLLDRGGTHFRMVQKFERECLVVEARIVVSEPAESIGWMVEFDDPVQAQTRTGWLEDHYYSAEVKATFARNARVIIRYLPQPYETDVVLNDHFGQVQRYWGFAYDVGIMFLVSWVIVVLHPEFLYIGYDVQPGAFFNQSIQRMRDRNP